MRDAKREIIQAFAKRARPIMLPFMAYNSCIGAARVAADFLRRYDMDVRVEPVKFAVEIKARKLAYCAGATDAELATAKAARQVWPRGWNGHLILVADNRFILDPAFDQAMVALDVLPPEEMLLVETDDELVCSGVPVALEFGLVMDDGTDVTARYIPLDDHSYTETEAWNDEGLPFLVSEIASRLFGLDVG